VLTDRTFDRHLTRSEVPLVVDFWAPWCAPCRREIPTLIEIQRDYATRGVRVLGIAFDGKEQVRRFAEEYDIERKFRENRLYQVAPISTNLILSYIAEHVLGLPRSY